MVNVLSCTKASSGAFKLEEPNTSSHELNIMDLKILFWSIYVFSLFSLYIMAYKLKNKLSILKICINSYRLFR